MKKQSKQRTPADVELTDYRKIDLAFNDKKGNLLFTIHFQSPDLCLYLHLGSADYSQMFMATVAAPPKSKAKKELTQTISLDTSRGFNDNWHLTIKGEPRFSLQLEGEMSEQLAYFIVHDDEGERITTFVIERDAAAKTALLERRATATIKARAEDLLAVQDRLEWENERYIELHDHFTNSDGELKELFMAILEAKAAPDDKQAQCKMLGYYLAAILTNDATPADLHNAVGDHVTELTYKDSPAVIGGVLWDYRKSKASEAEKGGEA